MPKKFSGDSRSAVSALDAGNSTGGWDDATALLNGMAVDYLETVKTARDKKERGHKVEARLYWAQAALLARYHRDHAQAIGDDEAYTDWSERYQRAVSTAFRTRNPLADTIGGGLAPDANVGEDLPE
jgi:hypothetical protein